MYIYIDMNIHICVCIEYMSHSLPPNDGKEAYTSSFIVNFEPVYVTSGVARLWRVGLIYVCIYVCICVTASVFWPTIKGLD